MAERFGATDVVAERGQAAVRGYIPELMDDVLAGRLDPSPVKDLAVSLDEVPEGRSIRGAE